MLPRSPFLFFCASLWGLIGTAANAMPVARLRGVQPIVEKGAPRRGWTLARDRTAITFGDYVRTGAKGGAQVLFNNGTQLVLRPRTQIEIAEPETPDKPLVVRVFGALGEVFVRAKGPTEIRTAAGIAAVRGTQYSVRLDGENKTILTVSEGRVAFFNPQGQVIVGADEQSSATVGSAPTPPVRVDASGLLSWTGDVGGLPLPFELPLSSGDDAALRAAKTLLLGGQAQSAATAFGALNGDEARAGRALSLLASNGRAAAQAALEGANGPLAQGVRALLLLQGGDAQGAQSLLQPLAAGGNAPFQVQTLLAMASLQRGDTQGAQLAATRAVAANPRSAGALATLSLSNFFAGRDKEARTGARRAVELDPFSPLALLALGRVEAASGHLDEARQALEQAASLAPDLPDVQRDLGSIELALDRLPRAERAFRTALERAPNDPRALAGLGTTLLNRGERAQAQTALNRAVELAPDDPFVRAQRAEFLVQQGDLAGAAREGDFLLARSNTPGARLSGNDYPSLGALYIRLSEAALFRQKLNDALRFAREAVRLLPSSAPAQYQLGRVFLEQGRLTQAQSRFQLAAILDPDAPRPRYALGYVQQLVAQGQDTTTALGQIAAARESAPNVALSLQDQSTPGASERLQAALQDPTSVRAATRSFGDFRFDGSVGSEKTASGDLSLVKESRDRRGLSAFDVRRDTTAGPRANAGSSQSLASVALGQKAKSNPSALFGYASFERIRPNGDTDFDTPATTISSLRERPQFLFGGNVSSGQRRRTRFYVQGERATQNSSAAGTTFDSRYPALHAEVRHDQRFGSDWRLSAGASYGQRRSDLDSLSVIPNVGTIAVNVQSLAHNTVAYARLGYATSPRLLVEGELKARWLVYRVNSSSSFSGAPPQLQGDVVKAGELLPTLVASWQARPSTLVRLRVRRLFGSLEDFDLLSPTDLFGFNTQDDVPVLTPGARGTSYETELNHTFADTSFLRVGLFYVKNKEATLLNASEKFSSSHVGGVRLGYEGVLNRQTTFFSSLSLSDSRGVFPDPTGSGVSTAGAFSSVPRFSGEVALQYLGEGGLFIQPSLAYLGPHYRPDLYGTGTRQKLGGFPLANVRIGQRAGLRRSFYFEVSNLFNRSYTLAVNGFQRQQSGRILRVGATLRF